MLDRESSVQQRDILSAFGTAGVTTLAGCAGRDTRGADDTEVNETTASEGTTGGTTTGDVETTNSGGPSEGETVNAAQVYISEIDDLGWSWTHGQTRQAVNKQYDWLETEYMEAVAPPGSERVFEQYVRGNVNMVFGTTFGYQGLMYTVTEDCPDTVFERATGYRTRENISRYVGRIYEPRYLAGQATGMITENNTIEYIAAFPIPEVVRSISTMALGVRFVSPETTFKIRWVSARFDPPTARKAADTLIGEGCDVIAQEQDSLAAVRAASNAGVWTLGYNAPMGQFGGENYLISPIWDWTEFYGPTLESLHEGSWEADAFWDGMEMGVPMFDEQGPNVSQEIKNQVAVTEEQVLNDELDVWANNAFEGESDELLPQEMSSFVEDVEGEMPS